MRVVRILALALLTAVSSGVVLPSAGSAAEGDPAAVAEIVLPAFQSASLASDEPFRDLLLEPNGTVWMLGRTSLWRWASDTRTLKRLKLGDEAAIEKAGLARLGSDGISLFALGESAMVQAQWSEGRVFRYNLSPRGSALGFSGFGDDFRIAHTAGLFHFDRYGRTLRPELAKGTRLEATDRTLYDAKSKTLWVARKNKLLRLRANAAKPVVTLTATHLLRGLAQVDGELILHTAHAVLLVGSNGKLKQSIPVEGRRKLKSMDVSVETHAYFFDDDLLEVFRPKEQTVRRYPLPVDGADVVSNVTLRAKYLALIADGRPRLFRVD